MKTVLLLATLILPVPGFAQSYFIDWCKVAAGGGNSSSGSYTLSGTIGQTDAGGPLSGGSYSLTGGFWAIINVVQTPGAPTLFISHSGNQAVVSWDPSATGWTLQTNNNLTTGTWGNYAGAVVNNSATNSPSTGNLFFRLKQ